MTSGPLLSIPRALYERILAHCREEWPREAVGFLLGHGGVVLRAAAVRNAHPDPERRFRVDPGDAALVLRGVAGGREEWVGLYHSHPHSVAYPSPHDLALFDGGPARGVPGPVFVLLISLLVTPPDVRAYRRVPGRPPAPVPHRKLDMPEGEWVDLR